MKKYVVFKVKTKSGKTIRHKWLVDRMSDAKIRKHYKVGSMVRSTTAEDYKKYGGKDAKIISMKIVREKKKTRRKKSGYGFSEINIWG